MNGEDTIEKCVNSLLSQTVKNKIIVIENGSTDNSLTILKKNYPDIEIIENSKNLGFAGGVNQGIKKAVELGAEYIALFNNDAVADKKWLEELINVIKESPKVGIIAPKILSADKKHLDSTGDQYTNWGLPYPRGRKEEISGQYNSPERVFSASGGASLYRVSMLK
ncbi:MAG: glycosyltransferase family 2 protein, partial [Bacteroidota bacterium]